MYDSNCNFNDNEYEKSHTHYVCNSNNDLKKEIKKTLINNYIDLVNIQKIKTNVVGYDKYVPDNSCEKKLVKKKIFKQVKKIDLSL